jgi:hypothetical protein
MERSQGDGLGCVCELLHVEACSELPCIRQSWVWGQRPEGWPPKARDHSIATAKRYLGRDHLRSVTARGQSSEDWHLGQLLQRRPRAVCWRCRSKGEVGLEPSVSCRDYILSNITVRRV